MKSCRAVAIGALLVGASIPATEVLAQAPPAGGTEMAPAKAAEVLAFFGRLMDAIVATTGDCAKMAAAMHALVDANVPLLKEINAHEAAGKRLPPNVEQQLQARMQKDLPSLERCATEPAVQAAMQRLGDPDRPVPAAPVSHPDVKAPVAENLLRYTKGLPGKGDLIATFQTSLGSVRCQLLPDKAPITVANFVGLATGKKPWLDSKTNKVQKRKPYYDGVIFHRVIPDFMIQGGDPTGTGMGGPGYQFADETSDLKMAPGVLAMANAGPGTNGSQFFITEGTPSYLDGRHTIFGQCKPLELVSKLARVKRDASDRPEKPLKMKVTIKRGKL